MDGNVQGSSYLLLDYVTTECDESGCHHRNRLEDDKLLCDQVAKHYCDTYQERTVLTRKSNDIRILKRKPKKEIKN